MSWHFSLVHGSCDQVPYVIISEIHRKTSKQDSSHILHLHHLTPTLIVSTKIMLPVECFTSTMLTPPPSYRSHCATVSHLIFSSFSALRYAMSSKTS